MTLWKCSRRAEVVGGKEMQEMAQEDPDLEPIWPRLSLTEELQTERQR